MAIDWQNRVAQAAAILKVEARDLAVLLREQGVERQSDISDVDGGTFRQMLEAGAGDVSIAAAGAVKLANAIKKPLLCQKALDQLKGKELPEVLSKWSPAELIEKASLRADDNYLTELLPREVGGHVWGQVAFIVLSEQAIDVAKTQRVMAYIEAGEQAPQDTFIDSQNNDAEYIVYRVDELCLAEGEKLRRLRDPLFPEETLDSGGVSRRFNVPVRLDEHRHQLLLHLRKKSLLREPGDRREYENYLQRARTGATPLEAARELGYAMHYQKALQAPPDSPAALPSIYTEDDDSEDHQAAAQARTGGSPQTGVADERSVNIRLSNCRREKLDVLLTSQTADFLRELGRAVGVSLSGSKAAMVDQLIEHDPPLVEVFDWLVNEGDDFVAIEALGLLENYRRFLWKAVCGEICAG